MFEWIIGNVGELRTDTATGTIYRFDGTTWNEEWTVEGSSDAFPTDNIPTGEVRVDQASGIRFRFDGTDWVEIEDRITTNMIADWAITTDKIADGAVTGDKLNIEEESE